MADSIQMHIIDLHQHSTLSLVRCLLYLLRLHVLVLLSSAVLPPPPSAFNLLINHEDADLDF